MMKFWTTKKKTSAVATQLRSEGSHPFGGLATTQVEDFHIYSALRDAVPMIDGAITKLVRLAGGFSVECGDQFAQAGLEEFLRTVPCGYGQVGLDNFLSAYLDSLLTYGRAVGEMVMVDKKLEAVLWGDVTRLELKQGHTPLEIALCDNMGRPLPYPELLLFSTLNAQVGHPYGVSLLRGMPFLADILMKIYHTIGKNWERAGNVRYSVVYKPSGDGFDRAFASDRSEEMATQWAKAMEDNKHGVVRDFVAVGDVDIKVIGADGKVLDSSVPVKQILEQLLAKTGLPPFLLGLSWSTTERMASQQADLLTTELWAIRRAVEPVLMKILGLWLRSHGYDCKPRIVWEDITLQDLEDTAQARLYNAQAAQIEEELSVCK
ncbi:MAG: serine/threonine protein phosphatase [Eubacteriales bacterium]